MNSNNQGWIKEGGVYYPCRELFNIYPSPGKGIFNLVSNQSLMDNRLGLVKVADKFEFPFKIYDFGVDSFLKKVVSTWNNSYFIEKGQNLGVILTGLKGTGKSVCAKILCNMLGIPVINISGYLPGSIEFISHLEFECVILLDEAEKTFNKSNAESSQALVKMIDGILNKSRKLYILTTNSLEINENLIGRPGRIRYIKTFKNIGLNAIKEYIDDNLLDKKK